MVKFSFIVLFHNNSHTDRVIDSIIPQMEADDEIIVVDDNSTSKNLKMFDRFKGKIRIIHSDISGNRAYNRNYGAKLAKNDCLFFVDGDVLLLSDTVYQMRIIMQKGFVGAVGNVIKGNNTPEQMCLLTGKDYMKMFDKDLCLRDFINLSIVDDRRQQHLPDKIISNSLWEYFFTAYCTIQKLAFDKIGGFDTHFKGWGVEDDEIGFRLSVIGELEYAKSAYGVHIPHPRNLYKCLLSNRINFYRFLAKKPCNEIEIHMTFGISTNAQMAIKYIQDSLIQNETYIYNFSTEKNCIYINELTKEYPNGYVKIVGNNSETQILQLFGLALPFKNKQFSHAYVSENIFIYPEFFVALILEEALRIAKSVRILKVINSKRIKWRSEYIQGLSRISTSGRIVYYTAGLCDFDVVDCENYYEIESGLAQTMNDNFSVMENFYMPQIFINEKPKYLLLNLTNKQISKGHINKIEVDNKLKVHDIYNISISLNDRILKLSKLLAGDLYRLHTPMVYLIPQDHEIDMQDNWWKYSFRENDIVLKNIIEC